MPLWTTAYLERISLDAEIEIARETRCIIDRLSIAVTQGQPSYLLPEYIQDIRKVLWRGNRLDPVGQIEYAEWIYDIGTIIPGTPGDGGGDGGDGGNGGDGGGGGGTTISGIFDGTIFSDAFVIDQFIPDPNPPDPPDPEPPDPEPPKPPVIITAETPIAKPWRYFYSTFGENVIHFNPNVNENIDADQNDLWGAAIPDRVIIEFYRVPDGINYKIPNYIRRRTIKSYVLWKSFAREGNGQNLNAAEFHRKRYEIQLLKAKRIINGVYAAAVNYREPYSVPGSCKLTPARPVLPWNYGIPAEDDDCE